MSETWARRAPLLGIAAAVIALISIIVGGTSTPDVDAPARDVINHYDDSAQVISAIAGALAALLVVFFAGTMRSRLRGAESLSNLVLVGGALFAFGIGIFAALSITLYDLASSDKAIDPGALQAINALNEDFFFPTVIGLAVWYWASGLAIFSTGVLPRWWGWVSVVLGVLSVLGPLGFFAFILSIPWVFVTAILLMQSDTAAGTSYPENPVGTS
jgi:hypothetical protein